MRTQPIAVSARWARRPAGFRFFAFAAAFCTALAASGEKLAFIGTTDKNPLEYALNETITFTVTLVDKDNGNAAVTGRDLKWTLSGDDSSLDDSGTATSDTPLVVTTASSLPGFVRLKVQVKDNGTWLDDKDNVFDGGAGADVMNIQEWPAPSNFASFWQTATNTLYSTPYVPVCTNFNPAGAASGVSYYLFDIPVAAGELNVTGILAKPANAAAGSCGIISHTAGYGFGRTDLPSSSEVLAGNIVVHIARHGENPWHPDGAYYTNEVQNGFAKNFCFRNNDGTVQDTDYYKMAMRDLRALQYAKSLPEWNGTTLETQGGSMGGWRAIALAALDSAVTKCTASIPWSADLAGYSKLGYMKGWRPDWTPNLDYIDLKNLATLVKCPVTFTAGLGDYVCPPSGEIQLYRALPEPKKVTFTQNMGHGAVHGPNAPTYVLQAPQPPPAPRTLNWSWVSGNSKLWSDPANWKDSVGNTNAVPRSGDRVYLTAAGYPSKNDIPGLELNYFKLASGFQTQDSSSQALIFRQGSDGIYNEGFMFLDIPILLEGTNVPFYSSTTLVPRKSWKSFDGNPCGVVKTGAGSGGLGEGTDFAGFKYVEVRNNGTWVYGVNGGSGPQHLEPGQVFTFAEANTKMRVGTQCMFTNFWLRETGTAVGGTHSIGTQYDNKQWYRGKLAICGTPPDDETVFTGTFIETVDFRWDPASSTKTFVLSGKTSTTTGNVEVANGTMRLTAGATYSQLGTLKLSGGANTRFVVDTVPNAAFHAQYLMLSTGNEKVSLAAGVTLTVSRAAVGGTRLGANTYTSANASWIEGAGQVVVEGIGGDRLNWVDGTAPGNRNWSNPNRWINQRTGANDTPKSGDILYQTSDSNSSKYNDIDGLELRQLLYGGGYSCPNGKAVALRADSLGINSSGFMHNDLPLKIEGTAMPVVVAQSAFMSIRVGFRSYDGQPCGVVKTGAGVLAIIPLAGSAWTGFRYVTLKEGSFALGAQGAGDMSLLDPGLELTFSGNASLTIEKNLAMPGLCIFETGAAVNGAHRLTGRNDNGYKVGTLTVTGSPRVDVQTFTGAIEGGVGFTWSPDSATKTFVFSGTSSKSTTTNQLSVTRGTVRLADGATFTALHALNLSGGAETRFEVRGVPATAFHATNLVLSTGNERVCVAPGAVLSFDAASVGGTPLPDGVYCSRTSTGYTPVDWMVGGGLVRVGDVPITLPPVSGTSVAGNWTANGGSDTAVGNAANWGEAGNTVLPDLADGSLAANFAAGSAAALDRNANFYGLSLAAPGAFAFTAPDPDLCAFLGAGGLTTSGAGRTYTLGWPLFLAADQTWTVAAGDTLNITGPVSGGGSLRIKGGGTVNLNAATEMGAVTITNATVNVNADDAFGSFGDPVKIDLTASKLTLNGVTLHRGFTDMANRTSSKIYIAANTENVIEGDIDFPNAPTVSWSFGANSSLRVKGSIKRHTTNWCYFGNNGTLYLDGPLKMDGGSAYGIAANKTVYFNAPSNDFGGVWFWFQGNNGRIFTTVPYAVTTTAPFRNHGGYNGIVWDMCGCDQGVKNIGSSGNFTVTSASPATLHLLGIPYAATDITNKVAFAGAANLSFEGTGYLMHNAASTSTGIVQVASGTFALGPAGSWTNATKAVVTGGKLKLENKSALGKETDMELAASGATVALDYSGTMKMHDLYLGGELKEAGVYGAANNTSVSPSHRLACFTGPGKILFLGNDRSTLLIFR